MERNYSPFSYRQEIFSSSINTLPYAQSTLELCNTHQNMEKRLFEMEKETKIKLKSGNISPEEISRVGKQKETGMRSYK